jgi:putative tricarboxylic transport membrane protein
MRISVDRVVLAILALLGIYDGIRVFRLPVFVAEPLGSGSYLIGLSTLLLAAVVVEALRRPVSTAQTDASQSQGRLLRLRDPEVQAWIALVLYSVLLETLGYLLSTLLYLIISIRIFGERRWVWVFGGGGILALFFHLLFQRLAGIPLP